MAYRAGRREDEGWFSAPARFARPPKARRRRTDCGCNAKPQSPFIPRSAISEKSSFLAKFAERCSPMTIARFSMTISQFRLPTFVAHFREDFTTDFTDFTDGKEEQEISKAESSNFLSVKSGKSVVPCLWLRPAAPRLGDFATLRWILPLWQAQSRPITVN